MNRKGEPAQLAFIMPHANGVEGLFGLAKRASRLLDANARVLFFPGSYRQRFGLTTGGTDEVG